MPANERGLTNFVLTNGEHDILRPIYNSLKRGNKARRSTTLVSERNTDSGMRDDFIDFCINNKYYPILTCNIGIYFDDFSLISLKVTEIIITNKKLILKRGWFCKTTSEQQLNKIDSVQVSQGFWGGIMDFGSININGSGLSITSINYVSTPMKFRREIQDAIE